MYLDYYKLAEQPFGVTPNPRYLYMSATHREAMASIYQGVIENRGFTAMIAHPGMGKTTLLFNLLQKAPASVKTVFLFQTQCGPCDLLRNMLADLGVVSDGQDMARMQAQLNEVLVEETKAGRRVVVVVDEAQNLSEAALEVLRVLSNFETSEEKLMHVILAGQPALAKKLASPNMIQLRQRVSIVARLVPFKAGEAREYIEYRLGVAGYGIPRALFSDRACNLIAVHSQGIPRNINNICFNAMALGCALNKKLIGQEVVREVLDDLNLEAIAKQLYAPLGKAETIKLAPPALPKSPVSWVRGAFMRGGIGITAIALYLSLFLVPCNFQETGELPDLATGDAMAGVPASSTPRRDIRADRGEVAPHGRGILQAAEPSPSSQTAGAPEQSLSVQLQAGETLYDICIRYFGRYNDKVLQEVGTLNPGLGDPKKIPVGQTVLLPVQQIAGVREQRDSSAPKLEENKQ